MNQEKNQFSLDDSNVSNLESKPGLNVLNKQQKISLISLGVFTVFIMVFGILQFRYNLYSPFDYSQQVAASQNSNVNNPDEVTTDLTKLDSDNDGLNDYDEINVYKTSAYLEDSDSDGFTDKDEILNSTDPNCPAGQTCAQVSAGTETVVDKDALVTSPGTDTSVDAKTISTENQTINDMLSGKSDPAVLRKLLLENGMEQADLDKISDEDLISSYQESLKNQKTTETAE